MKIDNDIFEYILDKISMTLLKIGFITFIVIPSIFAVAFVIYPAIYSDAKCEEFSTQLFYCDLPQGTRIIETYSATENFAPTGDNMCFLAIA